MILRALQAEGIRIKPAALWIPLISSVLFLAFTAMEWYLYFRTAGGIYSVFNVLFMFLSFVMLLNTALLSSLFASAEHESDNWKQLATLPVPRRIFYWSKAIWIFFLLLCTAVLIIAGMSLMWFLYTSEPLPFLFLVRQTLYSCLASAAVLALQLWLSVQLVNQAIPVAIGFLGAISSLFLGRMPDIWWLWMWPWTYTTLASPFMPNHGLWIGFSILVGLVLLAGGTLHFGKKQFY